LRYRTESVHVDWVMRPPAALPFAASLRYRPRPAQAHRRV